MIIDIHEHVIPRRGFIDPKRGETVCTATELVAIMDREGIDKMVALPLSSPETYHFVQSVEEVFEACDQYPERFIKFANVDPRLQGNFTNAYDFVPILEHYMSLGAVGVGEVTANLRWEDPRYHNLLSACDKLGLPFLFHLAIREFNTYGIIVDPQLKNLEAALKKYPNVKFLAHSTAWWSQVGIPKESELESYVSGPVQPGGGVPELLRKYPNLYGDLSAGSGCNAITRDPQWGLEFLDEFQDRLLFGLDICIPSNDGCGLLHYLKQVVGEGKLGQAVYDKVMGKMQSHYWVLVNKKGFNSGIETGWRLRLGLLILSLGLAGIPKRCVAQAVAPEAIVLAEKVHKPAFDLVRDVVAIPKTAADILRLPFGLVETALCPLPALEFTDGVGNVGKGIKAIPEFIYAVLKLPASIVSKSAKITRVAGVL